MLEIKDFKKIPSCCMVCPLTVIANNGKRYCRPLDDFILDDKKRMDECPFDKNKETESNLH